jgi:hypothetical protein
MHVPCKPRKIFAARFDLLPILSNSPSNIEGGKEGGDSDPKRIEGHELPRTSPGFFFKSDRIYNLL